MSVIAVKAAPLVPSGGPSQTGLASFLPAYSPPFPSKPQPSSDELSVQFMREDLARSGLTPEDMRAYPTAPRSGRGVYCIDYGPNSPMYRVRHDRATNKYIQPKGITGIWTPPTQVFNAEAALLFVEGEKKATKTKLTWPDFNVYGMGGCEMLAKGGKLLPEVIALISQLEKPTRGLQRVSVIFDGDILYNLRVRSAALNLQRLLSALHCELIILAPPPPFKGVDDMLFAKPDATFDDLVTVDLENTERFTLRLAKHLDCTIVRKGDRETLALNYSNALKILRHYWQDHVVYDRHLGLLMNGEPLDEGTFVSQSRIMMQELVSPQYNLADIDRAVSDLLPTQVDYVRTIIENTKWDGVERLDTWGGDHLLTDNRRYAEEWGRILMTGLGLRIHTPGFKVDFISILTGPQGAGKTTFFQELARFNKNTHYFPVAYISKQSVADYSFNKSIEGALVIDFTEGTVFTANPAVQDLIKALTGGTGGSYRTPYSKRVTNYAYGGIWVGTSNRSDLLSDKTGSRRNNMLWVDKIIPLPYETKLQILAEVFAKWEAGALENWYETRLTLDDIPIELRESNPHITDPRTLLNQEYQREDDYTTDLLELLECGALEYTNKYGAKTGWLFVTGAMLTSCMGARTGLHTFIRGLETSPTFPYYVVRSTTKARLQECPPVMRPLAKNMLWKGQPAPPAILGAVPENGQLHGTWFKKKGPG